MQKSKNQNKNQHAVTNFSKDVTVQHIPVMQSEVLHFLDPKKKEHYLDLTAGYGGHAALVLERTLEAAGSVLVDRDEMAVTQLRSKFEGSGITIMHEDYVSAALSLIRDNRTFDLVLADLGVSSPHLNMASRGFSFQQDAPLDMRMDQRQELTAEIIVNNYDKAGLTQILRTYGEEPKASQIADRIIKNRPIHSTLQLAQIVAQAWPGHSKVHPATRTFQALRIAVNDELGLLKKALPLWVDLLAPGGRLVVLSFQSLEDRIVKQFFQEVAGDRYDTELILLTKKPVVPGQTELVSNPRARSTKLRAVAKK
ncbi:MAG: rRNA ((1402)-N(4))-methyltransferase RsmH [Candidatus Saccharibacteria bacterium]|nr:rRNA ((1402)-N(4))-methyltransferase RsmH [Candidatus Saccharibacteria bacterium]